MTDQHKPDAAKAVIAHTETASRMLFRANLYFEAWWLSAGVEGRRQFKDFWDEYWEFWRFNQHAMQFAFVVYLASLFEARSDTVNFGTLWREAETHATEANRRQFAAVWQSAEPAAKSVAILRSNAMAHRSMNLSFNDAFKKAHVTPDELRQLLTFSWDLLNIVEVSIKREPSKFDPIAVETLRGLARIEADRIATEQA